MSKVSKKEKIGYALGMVDTFIATDIDTVFENILEQSCFEEYVREKADEHSSLNDAIFEVGMAVIYNEWLKL